MESQEGVTFGESRLEVAWASQREHLFSLKMSQNDKSIEQAGAELGQAQVELCWANI